MSRQLISTPLIYLSPAAPRIRIMAGLTVHLLVEVSERRRFDATLCSCLPKGAGDQRVWSRSDAQAL